MRSLPIASEGIPYIIVLAALSLILYFLFLPLAIIAFAVLLFVLFFFRDPNRQISSGKNNIVSPADGKVMSVATIYESTFLNSEAVKVSVFLSLLNVHINRSPIKGSVVGTAYRPGKYLPAFKSHASELNEKNSICIEGSGVRLVVNQITGFLARRIVCRAKPGSTLEQGERFGLIKFGSCTEIILPKTVDIKVKPGDTVTGGQTVIGVITDGA